MKYECAKRLLYEICMYKETTVYFTHAAFSKVHFVQNLVRLCMLPANMCLQAECTYGYILRRAHPEDQAAGVGMQRRTRPAVWMTRTASSTRTPRTWSGRRPSCSSRRSAGTHRARVPHVLRTATQAAPNLARCHEDGLGAGPSAHATSLGHLGVLLLMHRPS